MKYLLTLILVLVSLTSTAKSKYNMHSAAGVVNNARDILATCLESAADENQEDREKCFWDNFNYLLDDARGALPPLEFNRLIHALRRNAFVEPQTAESIPEVRSGELFIREQTSIIVSHLWREENRIR